jgi:Ala-tRNA(Pro) deacylase
MVKCVVVQTADGRKALLALEASERVDLAKAAHALGATEVHLVTEAQLVEMAPGCEPGTWPPVDTMFGLPVLADSGLRDEPEVTFNAGSHEFAVRLDQAAWARAANVRYVDLAAGRPDEPVWAR